MSETYKISGMHCASCATLIEKTVKKQPGVHQVSVNYGTEEAEIDFDKQLTTVAKLSGAITPLGYSLLDQEKMAMEEKRGGHDHAAMISQQEADHFKKIIRPALVLTAISVLFMVWDFSAGTLSLIPMLPEAWQGSMTILMLLMATYMVIVPGKPYARGVMTFFRYRLANMDTLVGLGTLTAYIYSVIVVVSGSALERWIDTSHIYFDVTIVVIGLITFGKYLESSSKKRTGDAIRSLLGLQVKTAVVKRDGQEITIPVSEVVHGDLVLIKPGMKIPVDGILVEGSSLIDEAMLTGEPIPVRKQVGDKVAAGTMNTTGAFVLKATGVGAETLLSQIIALVQKAQGSKAPIQKMADQISAVFVPIVLGIALLTLVAWIFIGRFFMPFDQALSFGLVNFVAVLVIACPCALGLATPTAIIVGVGKGAVNGILVKNAVVLQKLHSVTRLIIDKTGTLTEGKPEVRELRVLGKLNEERLLGLMIALEKSSEHPLAASIINYGTTKDIVAPQAANFANHPGQGISGVIEGERYYVGSAVLMQARGIKLPTDLLKEIEGLALTAIWCASEKELLGVAAVGDLIKPEAKQAIRKLHDLGIKVVMATGDQKTVAQAIAWQVDIDEVVAGLKPADKLMLVKKYQAEGDVVAVAGDGVNDAPAIAQADIGIAMGTGTDVAIETSDITLLHGDIIKISQAVVLSRETLKTIKQNLFWAFIYNIIGIPLATGIFYPVFGWLLSPALAGVAMAFSSVSVITNSLALKNKKI